MDPLVAPAHRLAARRFRALVASYAANRDLILMGAYREGADPQLDQALAMKQVIDGFLQQAADETVGLEPSIAQLTGIADNV